MPHVNTTYLLTRLILKELDLLTENFKIKLKHPREKSLRVRDLLIKHFKSQVVASAGLIAHGRGETFDYLLGEETTLPASKAIEASAATLLLAKNPAVFNQILVLYLTIFEPLCL